jgi:nicotinamidase-related amidase
VELTLDPGRTALVAIDLQKGILGFPSAPRPGTEVVARAAAMAKALRAGGGYVVLTRVTPSADGKDALHPVTDAPAQGGIPPADFAEIAAELLPLANIVITKHQWGAFYGTELDLQLRRRGIDTIVLCGISTTMGVETTARDAFERGYNQVFVEDAMAAREAVEHENTVKTTFPRIGRIRSTADVLAALAQGAPR